MAYGFQSQSFILCEKFWSWSSERPHHHIKDVSERFFRISIMQCWIRYIIWVRKKVPGFFLITVLFASYSILAHLSTQSPLCPSISSGQISQFPPNKIKGFGGHFDLACTWLSIKEQMFWILICMSAIPAWHIRQYQAHSAFEGTWFFFHSLTRYELTD